MKQVNSLILRTLVAQLDEQQIDSNGLLHSVSLNRAMIVQDDFTLSADVFGQLLENMVRLTNDERFGLKLGFKTPLSLLGKLGGLYQSCPTLAHMLTTMQQYVGWLDGINTYYWEEEGNYVHIVTACDPAWRAAYPLAARQMIEHNIGFSLRHKREYLGKPVVPVALALPYARSGGTDLLETYFDCPIQFDHSYLQITLPRSVLTYCVPSANERALRAYEAELASFVSDISTSYWPVRRTIENQLGLVKPTLQSVAQHLAQSPRSLQRQLQQEGTSFQTILGEVRLELAQHYEQTNHYLSKAELADRLSFGDSASLSRFLRNKKSKR